MSSGPSVLVIDNYDSFVYNLYQYLAELGASLRVVRNDEITDDDLADETIDGVLISPGPGHPRDAGRCRAVIESCAAAERPMLGVCLGHQALGDTFGASIVSAPAIVHGQASLVEHEGRGVFSGMPDPFAAGRYHSLVVDPTTLPPEFEVTAHTGSIVMGIRHRELPLEGVQFHPESVLTEDGYSLLANWLEVCGSSDARERARSLNARSGDVRRSLPDLARRT
ncbi:MAG: anthranilate synthase component II [Acidimicrobiales bacterium]